jgi:hypothetical protein
MPAKAYLFPEWLPDPADNALTIAQNVFVTAKGYGPVKDFQTVTSALLGPFNGGGAFIDSTGATTLLVATDFAVYKYAQVGDFTGSTWSAVSISGANGQVLRYAQFGDNVLVANGGPLYGFDLLAGTVTTLTDTPSAIDVAQVRDFVMVITTDNKIQWCQFNNSTVWTLGANQADVQPILSSSGVRLIGGEYAILLKKQGIDRISYVGSVNDIIFQFDEISAEVGCMAAGSVCNVGRLIFFLSERGFEMCDGQTVTPIGNEKFNRWFFTKYSRQDIAKIWAAVDPRNSLVLWAMPGTPGTIVAYNWVLSKATTFEIDVTGLLTGYTSDTSLEALDAIYGNIDAVPISLDSPTLQGGSPILMLADGSNVVGALTGDNLAAILRLENVEPTPGKRSRIRSLRLVSDTTDASATIDARMRAGDSESVRSSAIMRTNGKMPIRANGRYNTLEVTVPAGADWSYIDGCELEFENGDGR